MKNSLLVCLLALAVHTGSAAFAAEPMPLVLAAPKPHQVVQRVGFDPQIATAHKPGAASYGFADVVVRTDFVKGSESAQWEYRTVLLAGANGRALDWTKFHPRAMSTATDATVQIPAGGWYRLEIRCRDKEAVVASGSVEPIGVGEVFLVAGQSYATNCNDERLKVTDLQGRIAAFDATNDKWGIAHDPQPAPDNSDGGSIWPPLGDALVKEFQVPIGFVNVAVGATSSAQWLPAGQLRPRLVKAGKALGRFRAVLWQQGESDVIAKTATATYVANLRTIRNAAVDSWGFEAPWLLAKSTLHPTVYSDTEGESRIRSGIDELTQIQGFFAGPDTDTLKGDNRGDAKSRRHFTGTGQRNAAAMWFAVLKKELNSRRPVHEMLSELKLLEPAWSSTVVNRESCVLVQQPDGTITARLAFPAAEILEISTADRKYRYDIARDTVLSKDGLVVTIAKIGPLEAIKTADFFPPKDSPNSYRHRTGHPDQYVLYRPGRWFHDRDVEITYRRRDAVPVVTPNTEGRLPKTLARLRAGKSLTLGISGDSISTGADASAIGNAHPYQPGFPDLVTAQLESTFHSSVILKNRAVGGWSVANGVADLDKLLAEKPNLIVVAYGMNDVGRRDPKWYGQQTRAILDRIRAADPEIEVVLVSSMLGHGEWIHTPREMFAKYRDELKSLTGPGIVLADVTAVWELLLKNKHDLDLTGNGLNHPNDFGHRLYAQAILGQIIDVQVKPKPK